jgi:hypothetical protein
MKPDLKPTQLAGVASWRGDWRERYREAGLSVILTTSGYGDIVLVHPFPRGLANLEAVIGQLYPDTFLARLVTLHDAVADPRSGRREPD